jgi:lysyl oxidase
MTRRSSPVLLCAGVVGIALVLLTRGTAAQTVELRPNLVAFPAGAASLSVVASGGIVSLRFATTSWNNGQGPLELRAGEISTDGQRRKVYQRVYLSDGTYYDKYAGEFEYHPEHQHFHFENYALYTLKPVNVSATPKTSAKTTFCVMDTTKVNTTLPGAPQSAVYSTCGADIQGMSVGWGDTYGASLAGQSFDVTDNPDGDYDIIIEVDPKTQLVEVTRSDNVSCLRVRLSVSARTVKSLGACSTTATVTVDSITPNYMYSGTVLTGVTIKGSGFVPGMAVGFEGSGQAPIASDINVVDPSTITLTVTAKSAGGRRERLYDVRVSSAVLPKSFAVKP